MEEKLRKLGLSQTEARVYLALLDLGTSLAGDITKRANVNRTNCYDALQKLMTKGLVSFVVKANRKYFHAETPLKFLALLKEEEEQLKEKEKEVKNFLPFLLQKTKSSIEYPQATIFRGKKGIKSIYEDVLRYKDPRIFGSSGKFKENLDTFFSLFQKRVKECHIKGRLIEAEKVRGTEITKHFTTKYLPNSYITLISTLVYGDKVAIISWTSNPIGFVIEDKQTANSFKVYFDFMWQQAKA
jgi:sugar-specific transcriptional regulator TrmB